MKKLIVTVALSIVGMLCAYAQAPVPTPVQNFAAHPRAYTHRHSAWSEINFTGSIDSAQRWQYQIDYQYRRMSDASWSGGNTADIFKNPYQQVLRPWIHYWVIPKRVRLSLSPLGYWITYSGPDEGQLYKVNGQNQGTTVQPEFRICPQVTVNNQIGRLLFSNRYRYEFRFVGNRQQQSGGFFDDLGDGYSFYPNNIGSGSGSSHQGRFRWQIRAQLLLNSKKMQKNSIYLNVWNELFLAMGKSVDFSKMLNQDRLVGLVGWKLPTAYPIRLEAGVTFQTVYQYNLGVPANNPNITYGNRNVELNTAYTVYIIFDEFHTMFSKKKRPQDEPKFPHPER
ncbi:MAG TPA: DUF2490 domain-containing protein [Cytophaga sp.]|jgi:hypothetical protein|nr:DUF2490 domain-containing protein [Cytophaga sp.]